MENYSGKVAVITGGTSGLGYALAELLGKSGAQVVITGRREELGKKAQASLIAMGIEAMYVQHDTSVEESWDAMIKTVMTKYPVVDYLFNNAGVMARPKSVLKLTMNDWNWVLNTNVTGTLLGLRKFTGIMLAQENGGRIVTTASTASVAPFSMWGPYSVSKAAVLRLVESYQGEMNLMKSDKVKFNVSLPGVFESDVSNGTVYRNEKYKNAGEEEKPIPVSKAHTPDGDKLGMITAEEAAKAVLAQVDEGKFYIYTHPDLSYALIPEQTESLKNEKPLTDQAVFDFAFYAKKLAAQGIDAGGASRLEQMSR